MPILLTWFDLVPPWISKYINYKVRSNYLSIPKLQRCHRCSLEMWISNFTLTFLANYLSRMALMLIPVSKRDPGRYNKFHDTQLRPLCIPQLKWRHKSIMASQIPRKVCPRAYSGKRNIHITGPVILTLLECNSPLTICFPSQKTRNKESVSNS